MARRGRRRHRRGGMKLPILSLGILGAQVADAWFASGGDAFGATSRFLSDYIGYEFHTRTWQPSHLVLGYAPWLAKRFLVPLVRPGQSLSRAHLPISLS